MLAPSSASSQGRQKPKTTDKRTGVLLQYHQTVRVQQMSQKISGDAETVCVGAESAAKETVSASSHTETALQCLVKVAACHGVDLSVDGLRHSYAVGDAPILRALLLR